MFSKGLFCVFLCAAIIAFFGPADPALAQTCYLPANVADAAADQMKVCFKVILEKDPSKKNTIYQDAPCENFYQALLAEAQYTRAPNQIRKDAFCKQVVEWHPQKWPFAGYPYWKDCLEAAEEKPRFDNLASREQVRKLTSCLREYTDYQKKYADPVQYDSCSATFRAFEQAWQNGIIERSKSLPVYRLNCVHYGYAVRQFVFPNPEWTYCTGYPSSDPEAQDQHFYTCMQSSLAKLSGCTDALHLYETRLRSANMGALPEGYAPPSCQRIEGFIAAAQPVETSPAEEQPSAANAENQTLSDLDKSQQENNSSYQFGLIVAIVSSLLGISTVGLITNKYAPASRKVFLIAGAVSSTLSTVKLITHAMNIGLVGVQQQIMDSYIHITSVAQHYLIELPFDLHPPSWARHALAIWLFIGAANGRLIRAARRQEQEDAKTGYAEYAEEQQYWLDKYGRDPIPEIAYTISYLLGVILGPLPLIAGIILVYRKNYIGYSIIFGVGLFLLIDSVLTAVFLFKNYRNILDLASG